MWRIADNARMDSSADAHRLNAIRRRMVVFRWWMLAGLGVAVLSASTFLGIPLSLPPLLAVLLLLAAFNFLVGRATDAASPRAFARQLAVDLVALGVLLYLTGGATNPLISLLLLPVAIGAFALPARWAAGVAGLAIGLYSFLMLYSLPLPIADAERATRLHLSGMWLTFVVSVVLLVWFVTRMTAALRERDMRLAAAREESLRDAQVLALGQLAAGAAHELGTPLATMNVLAGELARDARLPEDARSDLALLCRQIALCKETVGGLARKAGIERAAASTAAHDWIDALLARWRASWPGAVCALRIAGAGMPPAVVADASIEQAVTNLLNNAARVSPAAIEVVLDWDATRLHIEVRDHGGGFPSEILDGAGAGPLTEATGSGIGLWLTRAAVERRGGRLSLVNGAQGGVATIELPLGGKT